LESVTPSGVVDRELHEELGILIAEPAEPAFAHLLGTDVDCLIWVIREWDGTSHLACLNEHDDVGWWYPDAIVDLPLADETYGTLIERAVGAAVEHAPVIGTDAK
jgi:hypothetical protein